MADSKHTVTVDFVANTQDLNKSMSSVTKKSKTLNTQGLKHQRQILTSAKEHFKLNKQSLNLGIKGTKAAFNAQRQLQAQLIKTNALIKQQGKLLEQQIVKQGWLARLFGGGRGGGGGGGRGGGGGGFAPWTGWHGAPGRIGRGLATGAGWGLGALAGGAATVGMTAGGFLLGAGIGQIGDSYQAKISHGRAYGRLVGQGSRPQLNKALGPGVSYGHAPDETAAQAHGVARATGNIGAVTTAQALGRLVGLDPGEASGFMGTLTRAGKGFGGKAGIGGKKELQQVMAAAFKSGLDQARVPEFISSVGSLVEAQAGQSAGDVSARGISALLAMFGASGKSGLQGARGGAVASALDSMIRNPGAGEAGQMAMLQAFGFGIPGGTTSYYDAKKRQQKGLSDPQNLIDVFSASKSRHGGGEAQIIELADMSGGRLSYEQLEAVRNVVEQGGGDMHRRVAEITKASLSIEEQALAEMKKGFGDIVKEHAGLDQRLLQHGDKLHAPLVAMRDMINKLVDVLMPAAVRALTLISEVMKKVERWFDSIMPAGLTETQAATNAADLAKAMTPAERVAVEKKLKAQRAAMAKDQDSLPTVLDDAGAYIGAVYDTSGYGGVAASLLLGVTPLGALVHAGPDVSKNRARRQKHTRRGKNQAGINTLDRQLRASDIAAAQQAQDEWNATATAGDREFARLNARQPVPTAGDLESARQRVRTIVEQAAAQAAWNASSAEHNAAPGTAGANINAGRGITYTPRTATPTPNGRSTPQQ